MSMFGGSVSPSLADIAAVTRNNDDNNGFGGNNGWWILIILFALFGGWGNNGYGRGNGGSGETTIIMPPTGGAYGMGGSGFMEAAVQRGFDNQSVITKLDGINAGICSLGYDQLAQMNGINQNIMQATFGITQAINADTVANMQNTNALSRQVSDCCCETRATLADLKYTFATEACAIKNGVHQTGDAIINNQNQGFQMLNQTIKDGFCNLAMSQKDQRIAELEAQLNRCDRDSALQGMSSYIINNLNPTPKPAWIVQNPNCCGPVPVRVQSDCGCGNGFNTCCGN